MAFNIDALTDIYKKPKESRDIIQAEITQRATIVSKWSIPKGSKVLEIGCGQGDCTVVLADAVGPTGHVTGLDPAPLTYGSPYNLGEAQAHLKASSVGSRITFLQADPQIYLQSADTDFFDFAIFCHSIWYFDSPAYLSAMLQLLRSRAKTVLIAEYALDTSNPTTLPHALAALSQAQLAANQENSISNIRILLAPMRIKLMAEDVGWKLAAEGQVSHGEALKEGEWEVGNVLDGEYEKEILAVKDERHKSMLLGLRDLVVETATAKKSKNETLRTMDSWVATFV